MATGTPVRLSVELFYSYAHSDAPLCIELQKHLTALKRSGLIREWYDRQIDPGEEWSAQIHEAMERAGMILLLVSADFLASKYISEIELPFAIRRHEAGLAKVVPVLLRPVEYRDSPFAKLQMLPSEARAVTSWPNQDEAFADIAGRLRELIYCDRLREVTPQPLLSRITRATQDRVLDAAIASSVVVDEPTDFVTLVRTSESGGLKAILQIDRTYSARSDDVKSQSIEIDFPTDASGKPLAAALELVLESPGFDPPQHRKKIRVPSTGDSGVAVFMLTPKRAGVLRLNLQALSSGVEIGSRTLVTMAVPLAEAQPLLAYGVTSLPLPTEIGERRMPLPLTATQTFGGSMLPGASYPSGRYEGASGASGPKSPTALPSQPMSQHTPPPAVASIKPKHRAVWIGLASSAVAIVLVSTTLTWNGNNATRSPASPRASGLEPEVAAVTAAIQHRPAAADLYVKRAELYRRAGKMDEALMDARRAAELAPNDSGTLVFYAELLERLNLQPQALQEYKRIPLLKPSPEVQKHAAERADALEHQLPP